MSEDKQPRQDEKVECKVCMKEVPLSEARSEEATDYVVHFCGLECYSKWKQQNQQQND